MACSFFRLSLVLIFVAAFSLSASAQRRDLVLPASDGSVTAFEEMTTFVQDGTPGFHCAPNFSFTEPHLPLFSFSVADLRIISEVDLTADFYPVVPPRVRSQSFSIKLHEPTRRLAVYGLDSVCNRKLLLFAFDDAGRLTRLWETVAPSIGSLSPLPEELVFSTDGARIIFAIPDPTRNSGTGFVK